MNGYQKTASTGPKIRSGWDISFPQSILWGVMGSAAGFATSLVRERSRGTLLRLQTSPVRPWQVILGKGLACFIATMLVVVMVTLGTTEEGVGGAGWAINMVMAMFSGAMMPLAFMPSFMQSASNFSPVKWAIVSREAAIWRNYTFYELLWPWTILLTIGATGFAVGLYFFQRNQR